MSSFLPIRSPMFTAMLAALSLAACDSGTSPAPECEGDDCELVETPSPVSERDGGAKPGKNDGGTSKPRPDAGGDKVNPPATASLPCDVKPLIDTYCGSCHGPEPKFGAPVSLVTPTDFQAKSGSSTMAAQVKTRINETDPREAMPPSSAKQPTKAELAIINAWLDKGAPAASGTCAGDKESDGGTPADPGPSDEGLECYKLTAHSGDFKTPYKVGIANDAYFNFVFKAPWQGTVYGIVARPLIDNDKVIHHWLLFQDNKPGKPGGAVKSVGAHPDGQLVHGWAPGGDPMDFRKAGADVGLELPGDGQTYTMEYHYNSKDPNATDASGVEMCVTRKKPANIAGLSWLGNDNLLFPSTKWTGICRPTSTQPIHIVAVNPHMHKQGVHMKGIINRKDGTKEVLHDAPFDFDYQRTYDKDVVLNPGDTITTECTYAQPMTFGEGTEEEMCYLFTMAYPKGALASPDIWGGIAHGGSSCLGQ